MLTHADFRFGLGEHPPPLSAQRLQVRWIAVAWNLLSIDLISFGSYAERLL